MKEMSIHTIGFVTVSLSVVGLAFLAQACGGGNNNVGYIPPQPAVACVGVSCSGAVAGNPMALMDVQVTGNRQMEYAEFCASPYENVRHIIMNGVSICRFRIGGTIQQTINEAAILTPTSPVGGLDTGIRVFGGDRLELLADGHYSHRKPSVWKETLSGGAAGCHNEIGVEGSIADEEGDSHITHNAANGQAAGLFAALSDGRVYSEVTAVGHESKTLSVAGTQDLFVGYNTDRIECGSIKLRYRITRCMDANLNTYPCPKE